MLWTVLHAQSVHRACCLGWWQSRSSLSFLSSYNEYIAFIFVFQSRLSTSGRRRCSLRYLLSAALARRRAARQSASNHGVIDLTRRRTVTTGQWRSISSVIQLVQVINRYVRELVQFDIHVPKCYKFVSFCRRCWKFYKENFGTHTQWRWVATLDFKSWRRL